MSRREAFERYRSCARKKRYATHQEALEIMEKMLHSHSFLHYSDKVLLVYKCKFAQHYHIGRAKKPREMILNFPDGWDLRGAGGGR